VRSETNSQDQGAQDRLKAAIDQLLPDYNMVRVFTESFLQEVRARIGKPAKPDPLDHFDYLSVTETVEASTGKMTVEITLVSDPHIPKHDFHLGPDSAVRIDGCTLPQAGNKGERSCQKLEIEEIAEKIKAHDKEHDQGKYYKQ
jgi:hypothetical protein